MPGPGKALGERNLILRSGDQVPKFLRQIWYCFYPGVRHMGLFDSVFDELSKEIKEAPGWLSLVLLCNALLLLPAVRQALASIGLEQGESTAATLVALIFFFVGDLLDTFFFPREADAKIAEKILKTSMLLLGGGGVFLLFTEWRVWGGVALIVWVLVFPIYRTYKRPGPDPITKGCPDDEPPGPPAGQKGCPRLVFQYEAVLQSKNDIRTALGIWSGIYAVSMSLARRARRYTWYVWLPNESGKFVRSTAFPILAIGIMLLVRGAWPGALLIAVAPGLLLLSFWLKGLHIRRLYRVALALAGLSAYSFFDAGHGVRVFFWCDDAVGTARVRKAETQK
jgi:hypothetical protein